MLLVVLVPPIDPGANEASSFLPPGSPSRRSVEAIWKGFPNSVGLSEAAVIFERRTGELTDEDFRVIEDVARRIRASAGAQVSASGPNGVTVRSPASVSVPNIPFTDKPVARNPFVSGLGAGQAALIVANIPANFITLRSAGVVEQIRDVLTETDLPGGIKVAVTGSSGVGHDYAAAAQRSHHTTLYVTLAAVVLVLLLVYRAPIAAAIPLVAISLAAVVAMKVLAIGERFGMHVGTAERIFVFVLLYGAGTDYSLLLISRYREYLDSAEVSSPRAVANALGATFPAILASAGTDAVGLLMLVFAQFAVFRSTGPAVAVALAVAMLAAVTLVPSLLGVIGPRVFWPRSRAGRLGGRRLWSGVARAVTARPGVVFVLTLAILIVPAVRGASLTWIYDSITAIKPNDGDKVGNAAAGMEMARRHWPVGYVAPVSIMLRTAEPVKAPAAERISRRVTDSLRKVRGVEDVRSLSLPLGKGPTPAANVLIKTIGAERVQAEYLSADGRAIRLTAVLDKPAMTLEAMDVVRDIRRAVADAAPGAEVFVAGATAEIIDVSAITQSDFYRVATLVLLVIFVMVMILLRDVILSAFMVASTVLSYLSTLGISYWVLVGLLGMSGLDWKVEVFLFVVIAAVGVDYNIFLASRMSEESRRLPLRQAVRRSVIHTGPVISSCGIIMAATLGSLMAGELVLLQQLGFALALGMLIDTFIVRPVLLPAFTVLTRRNARRRS